MKKYFSALVIQKHTCCCETTMIRPKSCLHLSTITNSWPGPLVVDLQAPFVDIRRHGIHTIFVRHPDYGIHHETRHGDPQETGRLLRMPYLVLSHDEIVVNKGRVLFWIY